VSLLRDDRDVWPVHRAYGRVSDSHGVVGGVLETGEAVTHPTLFDQEPPSVPVDTSEHAAERVRPDTAYWRAEVYGVIKARGGATCREIAQALNLNENTVRPRLWELEGNAPAGRPGRVPVIRKSAEKRGGMRVYRSL
jgi:hypothetical protein